jgi:putative phage-type endonuclease
MNIDKVIENLGHARLVGTFENQSDAWHDARKNSVGGSEVGAILGVNAYESAFSAWARKTGKIPAVETSLAMLIGTTVEPAIFAIAAYELQPAKLYKSGTWESVSEPWKHANVDGFIEYPDGSLGILEIKHTATYTDALPATWEAQVKWYCHVTGLTKGVVVALVAGRFKTFEVEYDPNSWETEAMLERVQAWWDCVQRDEIPEWDGAQATYQAVSAMTEPGAGDRELGQLGLELWKAKQLFDDAEAHLNEMKSRTLHELDGLKNGVVDGQLLVTLQRSSSGNAFLKWAKGF